MILEHGIVAVKIARSAAETEASGKKYTIPADLPNSFDEESGAFVTICEYPSLCLRACIGYPSPIMPLGEAIAMSALGAVHDPRFPQLTLQEAESCVFEVTVLTPPEIIEYESIDDLKSQIEIGRDGLIIEYGGCRGLFLPQVPVEQGWNMEEYLSHLCLKAGLRKDTWKNGKAVFRKFRGEIYEEKTPRGDIVKRE